MSESRKLLVIDEETYLLRNFVQLAESAGYRVEGSPDTRTGWDLARRLRPDIILVNTLPPEGTGKHLCRKVKAEPVLAHTAIMMLAGGTQNNGVQPDLPGMPGSPDIDVDEYILKPITSRDLLARVQAMLRVKHSEAQLAQIRKELQEKQSLLVTAQQQLRTSQQHTQQVLSAAQQPTITATPSDLYETLPLGCCTVDSYGFIIAANTLAAQHCGVQRTAFVETLFPDYLADDDVGTFFEHLARAFKSTQRQTCDVTLKSRDSQPRALRLETRVQPTSGSGENARCTIALTDITTYVATARQHVEQVRELQQNVQFHQKLHEQHKRREQRKQQEERTLSAQQKAQKQHSVKERDARQTRREGQIEAFLRTQERLQATIETHYMSQETYDRKVNELQRLQEAVQHDLNSERCRLEAILDSVNDGVTLCDITGYFDVFNARMQEITGYSQEQANKHMDFQLVLYPDPRHYHQAIMRMAAITSSGQPQSCITTIRAKDGTEKTLTVYTSRIECGQQEWLLSTYQDITEYRKLKQKLIRTQKRQRKSVRV